MNFIDNVLPPLYIDYAIESLTTFQRHMINL